MDTTKPKEAIPETRIEEWVLTKFGYGHKLDFVVVQNTDGQVLGRNFLDAYGNSPHRQQTEDFLLGLKDLDESDPDFESARQYAMTFLKAQFGEPNIENL